MLWIYCRYEEWNCSIEVVAGPGMDGVTAVVEHMDLRQEETGHWDRGACPDYIDVRTDSSLLREHMCGQWDIQRDHQLTMAGRDKNIVGYCYEDRHGHSCETKNILVDVAIDHNQTLSDQFPGLRKEDRHGFTLVFTAWKHSDEAGECAEAEMMCPTSDGGAHKDKGHCIWQKMYCDGHQNCGFLTNKDEWGCRLGRDAAWSFGTITVLVTIWVAIVTILMLATVFLLQWNRITFRTPLDMLAENRTGVAGRAGGAIPITTTSDRREAGHVMSTTTAADPRTGGMVSIMVMYRPPAAGGQPGPGEAKTIDMPPTYDSLFVADENPPGYNMLTVNLPSADTLVPDETAAATPAGGNVPVVTVDQASILPTTSVSTLETSGAASSSSSQQINNSEDILMTTSNSQEPLDETKQVELIEIDSQDDASADAAPIVNQSTRDDQRISERNSQETLTERNTDNISALLTSNLDNRKANITDSVSTN